MNKRTPRLLILLLLIVAFAATPFFWLIARDIASVSFVSEKQVIEQRKRLIFASLADEVQRHRDMDHVPGLAMTSIVLSHPSCETVVGGEVRIDHETSRTKPDSIYRNPAEVIGFFRSVAPGKLTMRGYEISRASQALGSFEASALRACIAATPFQGGCIELYEKMVRASDSRFEEGLVELGFLKVVSGTAVGSPGYCYSLPNIEALGDRP